MEAIPEEAIHEQVIPAEAILNSSAMNCEGFSLLFQRLRSRPKLALTFDFLAKVEVATPQRSPIDFANAIAQFRLH